MQPEVTVIMPVYNAAKYMRESIESVRKQTYENWTLLLIDDGSKDESAQIIEEYVRQDKRIKMIAMEQNSGVAAARNRGIEAATGEYIAFLDSDDQWKPEKLEHQVAYMQEKNCGFSYSAYDVIDEEGNYIKTITPYWEKVGYEKLLNTNVIACCTVMVRTEYMKANPMPAIKHEDYAAWLNILKNQHLEAECIPGNWAIYRKVKGSVSSNKLRTIAWNWNIYRNNQKLSFFRSIRQVLSFICMTGYKYIKR